jgi:hypothetical protein
MKHKGIHLKDTLIRKLIVGDVSGNSVIHHTNINPAFEVYIYTEGLLNGVKDVRETEGFFYEKRNIDGKEYNIFVKVKK